jgi:hypothetical protein
VLVRGRPTWKWPAEPPKASKPPAEPWIDAERAAGRIADIRVRVVSVIYDHVRGNQLGTIGQSKKKCLIVRLNIENLSPTKKHSYHLWGDRTSLGIGGERFHATLKDEFGNSYLPIEFGLFTEVGGQQRSGVSIYPGKPLEDVLVFEEPVGKAKVLKLELPGGALDKPGSYRFRIPISMVTGLEGEREPAPLAIKPPAPWKMTREEKEAEAVALAKEKETLALAVVKEKAAEAARLAKETDDAAVEAKQKAIDLEIDKKRVLADLKSQDPKRRKAALRDVGILGERTKEAAADLVALLDDNLSRGPAAKALAAVGAPAVPELLKGLCSKNFFVRQYSAQALGQIGPDASIAAATLRSLAVNDPSAAVREAAAIAAKKIAAQ